MDFQVDPELIAQIKAVQQGQPMAKPGNNIAGAIPEVLFGLGEIAGGIGQVQSGGRLPNVASQMRAGYENRKQQQIDNQDRQSAIRQRDEAMTIAKEKAAMEKLTTGWTFMKEVADRLDGLDEETRAKVTPTLAPLVAEKMGMPELLPVIEFSMKDGSKREMVQGMFSNVVERYGPRVAVEMFKKPETAAKLPEMEKKFASEKAFNQLSGAAREGIINKDVTPEKLETIFPGMYGKFDEDQKLKLKQLGFTNFKTKGLEEAEAKATIETEGMRQSAARQDKTLAQQAENQARLASQFNQQFSLAQQREARLEEQNRRILPSQQKILSGNRTAVKAISDYEQAYDEFVKESKGETLSDIFRGAIAKNTNAQRASDLATVQGRTPAEKKLAAKYNALVGNIRNLTDEVGVLTDVDAVRILSSFNPAQDRAQVKANLQERKKTHLRAYETAIEDYQAMGKDVSRFTRPEAGGAAPAAKTGAAPSQAEIEAAKKRLGIK